MNTVVEIFLFVLAMVGWVVAAINRDTVVELKMMLDEAHRLSDNAHDRYWKLYHERKAP